MPPVSGRRRARKEVDMAKEAEIDVQDPQDVANTPSRKRRKVNGTDNAAVSAAATLAAASKFRQSPGSDDTIDNQVPDPEAEVEAQYQLADEVIRHLKVASYDAIVAQDYNNDVVDRSAQAFAKIAGHKWTFYVSKLSVAIGRPNNKKIPENATAEEAAAIAAQNKGVDIDLGPDQQISRLHAEISFDHEHEKWCVIVNGRNGCYVDDQRLERGEKQYLHSGMVINILGTQMMFMLPGSPPIIHPRIQKQVFAEGDDESEPDVNDGLPPPSSLSKSKYRANGHLSMYSGPTPMTAHQLMTMNFTPDTPARRLSSQPQSKTSPSYHRGVMMESTEEIDYSLESAKDIKPPHSYASMIGQAILSTPEENATLAKIYEHIKENYAYFRHAGPGWQNSIRHNLSLNKSFEKIPRRTDEPGKGMKWQIVPDHRDEFIRKNILPSRRTRNVGSSAPNSPATNFGAVAQTERLMDVIGESSGQHKPNRSTTPPPAAYPAATESFTPDRGPQPSFLTTGPLPTAPSTNTPPMNSENVTPSFSRTGERAKMEASDGTSAFLGDGLRTGAFQSPPTLGTSQYDVHPGTHLFTPLVPRQKPLAAVQSTCKAPSFYAKDLFSSPAPFWKYADIGSTPARLPELSPFKPATRDEDDQQRSPVKESPVENDESDTAKEKPQPSSPPALSNAEEDVSPTRTVSRPVSRRTTHVPKLDLGGDASPSKPQGVTEDVSMTATEPDADFRESTQATEAAADVPEVYTENATPSKPSSSQQQDTKPSIRQPSTSPAAPPAAAASLPPLPAMLGITSGTGALGPRMGVGGGAGAFAKMDVDDDEDGEIDLARGFEKIGSFHRTIQANTASR